MSVICTIDDVKNFAGITSTNSDVVLQMLLADSLQAIGSFCNRNFVSQPYVEYRDGNDATKILTANYPLTAVASVMVDGVLIPQQTAPGLNGWFYIPGSRRIVLVGYKFSRGDRNVILTYTAGFGDAGNVAPWPADLQMALIMYIVTRYKERERLGVGSKSLAGESVTFTDGPSGTSSSSGGIPSAARGVLFNYMNTVPETGQ
jgi:hypothetical protein